MEDPVAGRVESLFIKLRRGEAVVELDPGEPLECLSGLGLGGDIHANRLSPRQILITLQSELAEQSIRPGALFENMVVSMRAPRHFRPGAAIVTAGGVEIKLTMYCEPCKRILPVVGLRSMINRRGILGYIVAGGEIRTGDAIEVIAGRYPALPESPAEKFRDFVATIPVGRVVRYLDVTIAMGVDNSFVRAIPGFIKRNISDQLPVHRIVDGRGRLLNFIPGQAKKLVAEGVSIDDAGAVDLNRHGHAPSRWTMAIVDRHVGI
jgi:alkylated DNA nucleotide flippase Atl1